MVQTSSPVDGDVTDLEKTKMKLLSTINHLLLYCIPVKQIKDVVSELSFTLWFSCVAPCKEAPVYLEQNSKRPGNTGLGQGERENVFSHGLCSYL